MVVTCVSSKADDDTFSISKFSKNRSSGMDEGFVTADILSRG